MKKIIVLIATVLCLCTGNKVMSAADLAVSAIIISPEVTICDMTNKELKAVLTTTLNQAVDLQGQSLTIRIGSLQPFTYPLSGVIPGNSSDTIIVEPNVDLTGITNVEVYLTSPVDSYPFNDTATQQINIYPNLSMTLNSVTTSDCLLIGSLVNQEVILRNTGNMDLQGITLELMIIGDNYTETVKENRTIDLLVGDTILYSFENVYTVPEEAFYMVQVKAYLSCDSMLLNVRDAIYECVDKNDLLIESIIHPNTHVDTTGSTQNITITVENKSDNNRYLNINIISLILDMNGEIINIRLGVIPVIEPLSIVPFTFAESYIVPNDSVYFIMVYLKSYDNYPVNDTLIITVHTVTDDNYNDLSIISIDNPLIGVDTIGKDIRAVTTIRNQSNDSFTDVIITLQVRDSRGEIREIFSEMIRYIAPSSMVSYTFTNSYMVPDDSLYYLMIYLDSYDNYPVNDTIIVKRYVKTLKQVTLSSNNSTMGIVTGSGNYIVNTTTTITATPYQNYRFVQWNDGDTNNPRTITVTQDTVFTAIFVEQEKFNVYVTSNSTMMGSVTGSGIYATNRTVTINAIPNTGYQFIQWNDGNTQNPRTITVTQDTSFTAMFDTVRYTLSLSINDNSRGVVSGNGTYAVNSIATITAVPNVGYRFVCWDDGNKDSIRVITVTKDIPLVALFGIEGMYYIYAAPTDPKMGNVIGSNDYHKSNGKPEFKREYAANSVASIEAIPNTGYRFIAWNDSNTDNPREITVTGDSIFMAIFDIGTAIEDIETSNIKIYPNPTKDNIHIALSENIPQAVFTLYDMQGKVLIRKEVSSQETVSVSELAAGIYIYNVRTDKQNYTGKIVIKN